MEKLFGLIGYPLSHSWSAGYFTEKFRKENIEGCRYEPFPIDNINKLPGLLSENKNIVGLNVTIPYKEAVIPLLNSLSDSARAIGAVNTIKTDFTQGKPVLTGFNTDVVGFEKSLSHYNITIPSRALILGTGGASKAVKWVLEKHNCEVFFAGRNASGPNKFTYEELAEKSLQDFPLIINATPLGMSPHTQNKPNLPYETLDPANTLYDLIYNPAETSFLKEGKLRGCKTFNGLYMLQQQAEAAWEIWTGE